MSNKKEEVEYINNDLLKKNTVEKRVYQELLSARSLEKNTLVVAPTGLGKTIVAILLISYVYKENKNILFLSPTKPLIAQHYRSLQKTLNIDSKKIVLLTGNIPPAKRKEIYEKKGLIICATPQTIRNDINNKLIDTNYFNLLIFDEAHRAIGNYSYCEISSNFNKDIKRLALTASPGSNIKKIKEVAKNLNLENIEIKTDNDIDVIDYIKDIDIDIRFLELDPISRKISNQIDIYIYKKLETLRKFRIKVPKNYSKKQLLEIQKYLFAKIRTSKSNNKFNYIAVSIIASILKFLHAKELIQCQGYYIFEKYLHKLIVDSKKKKSRAVSQVVNSKQFSEILKLVHKNTNKEYSKVIELKKIVNNFFKSNPNSKILVFSNFRDNANYLAKKINELDNVKAVRFVGQTNKEDDKGLSQKDQANIISDFKDNKYNVLVCTSVGEEGLDIPSVDLVVFYDAVASEIRQIQRRGRTGRLNSGKVIVLINKNTIDETYYYVSKNKEKKMKELLSNFNNKSKPISAYSKKRAKNFQKKLFDF
jgi:Fanconi anemia group M protein